jgi:outer membrane protein assembly factor BamB
MNRLLTRARALALGLAVIVFPAAATAGDWPGWRGPTGQGHTDEKDLPLTWDGKTGQNILWSVGLPAGGPKADFNSPGHSSPIVWRGRVFVTAGVYPPGLTQEERKKTIADHHVAYYRAADGKKLWDTVVPPGKCLVDNGYHGYAVPTPCTDGEHVFALFCSGALVALDLEGRIVWREELPRQRDVDGGTCSSPVLYEDSVIVPGIGDGGLRAYEKKTGKLKWEQKTRDRNRMATPVLARVGGRTQLLHAAGGVQGLDPATGELLWWCRAPSSQSTPVLGGGLVYVDAGRGGQNGAAVDPTGKGDVSKTHLKWQAKISAADGSSAIAVGDYLYRVSGGGLIRCIELATGEIVYEERVQRVSGAASPIASADGRIYFASAGRSYVVKAGPKFEVLAANDLGQDGDQNYATPAVSDGRIFIKGRSYLWCIGTREKK